MIYHINDTKILHIDSKVVDGVISMLEEYFSEIKVARGKINEFLSMIITYQEDRKF